MLTNLNELFPELNKKQEHFFSEQEFLLMPYFKQFQLLQDKQMNSAIKKSKKHFKLVNLKKGTVIYTVGMPSNSAYFLCYGSVVLLIKKNNRQRTQNYPKHILHQSQQRVNFLNQEFGIPKNKCQTLMSQFYQQKILFKMLQYERFYGQGYFGFNEMFRSNTRAFTAIATEDTVLLQIQKPKFQASLKDLQIKKQEFIITTILHNVRDASQSQKTTASISKEITLKMSQIFNYFMLKTYEKNQVIFKENQPSRFIYFILRGQIQLKKTFKINIPKKLIQDQNKSQLAKQIQVKVSRLSQKCYLGEAQFFLNRKTREFTSLATQNNTILVQIQPMVFMKMIGSFVTLERELTVSAKQKFSLANQNYLKQKNKVINVFLQQMQKIQNKKKQKILTNFLVEDQEHNNLFGQTQSTTFQIFSKEGMFFRDTYQKLQGFQEFQVIRSNNKRAAIRKYKVQINDHRKQQKLQNIELPNYPSLSINRNEEDFQMFDSKQKLLYSPKKNLKVFDFMSSAPTSPVKQQRQASVSSQGIRKEKRKATCKFHDLQKDEAVFKRVLIRNGRYEQDKATFKSNIVKPMVHPQFDDIVKQCMSRKSQVIRKAIGQKRNQLVKNTYQGTVQSIKNKSFSISKFSNVSLTCKGTEQFRKKLEFLSRNPKESNTVSAVRNRVAIEQQNLQACIGVNQPPKSSYQKHRGQKEKDNQRFATTVSNNNYVSFGQKSASQFGNMRNASATALMNRRQSPQKLVLLNHMMKPMTYSSIRS